MKHNVIQHNVTFLLCYLMLYFIAFGFRQSKITFIMQITSLECKYYIVKLTVVHRA